MKFIKELDYPLVLLILYIIKSVVLPGVIDLGVLILLGTVFVLRLIANRYFDTKARLSGDNLAHDRFKFLEELTSKEKEFSEGKFRDNLDEKLSNIMERLANVETTKNLKNFGARK